MLQYNGSDCKSWGDVLWVCRWTVLDMFSLEKACWGSSGQRRNHNYKGSGRLWVCEIIKMLSTLHLCLSRMIYDERVPEHSSSLIPASPLLASLQRFMAVSFMRSRRLALRHYLPLWDWLMRLDLAQQLDTVATRLGGWGLDFGRLRGVGGLRERIRWEPWGRVRCWTSRVSLTVEP